MDVKVKICGLTTIQETLMLNKYKADYAGFVMFYEKSKRFNTVQNTWQILRYLDRTIKKVAVTVSPTTDQVRMIEQMDFQILQVHGKLSDEVRQMVKIPVWYAYPISENTILSEYRNDPKISGYLLDGAVPGSGKTFEWSSLKEFDRNNKMLILAGGLTPENVQNSIEVLQPDIVDVSSGVEGEHGKDENKIKEFIRKVRTHE